MRVLVTGGSGYVGGPTVRRLADEGAAVIVVDRVEPPSALAPSIARFVHGDIRTAGLLDRLFDEDDVDAVVHLAADKSVEESVTDPGKYFSNNVGGTLALVEAMDRSNVRSIIFSSTCAVYGTPDEVPVTEATRLAPESAYGASKMMAEGILDWFRRGRGFRTMSLRYFNAAGASLEGDLGEDWTEARALVPRVIEAVLGRSGPLTIFGTDYPTQDGTAIRDYIHIVDLAEAHTIALRRLADPGASSVVNLGTGTGSSVREVIAMTEEITGRTVPIEIGPRRPGDVMALWADTTRARGELDWRPRYTLREMVETAWRWHRSGGDGAGERP